MPARLTRALSRSYSQTSIITGLLFACGLLVPYAFAEDKEQLLQPFTSDGCSVFPDGTWAETTLWESCCFKHDYDYWKGGTQLERETSDKALQQCVTNLGEAKIAELMLAGVRAGGGPLWPTPYRWGYGWPLGRGYKALSDSEQKQVDRLSKNIAELRKDN